MVKLLFILNDVVTYVGNRTWSVSHETMVGKSPDNQE